MDIKNKRKLFILLFLLSFFLLACIEEALLCELTGGIWINSDYVKNRPYSDSASDYTCARNIPKEDYEAWKNSSPQDESDVEEEVESPSIFATCNGTQYLQVTSEIIEKETSQFGTQNCDYKLIVTNTHPNSTAVVFIYEHIEDAVTNGSYWVIWDVSLTPGQSHSQTFYNIIPGRDDLPSTIEFVTKIAGVFDLSECADLMEADNYLEEIATPIEPVCP